MSSTLTEPILVKLTDFNIALGTITDTDKDGVTSYDCIEITTDNVIIRAILPGHLTEERRKLLALEFAMFLEEFTE